MGQPGQDRHAPRPGGILSHPFNPRAKEAGETRNGFVGAGNTATPCAGGTCSYAPPNAQFEGGNGVDSNASVTAKENGCFSEFPFEQMYLGSYSDLACRYCTFMRKEG